MVKTKKEMDKETMFNKIMPSFAEHLQSRDAYPADRESSLNDDAAVLFGKNDGQEDINAVVIYNITERLVLKAIDEVLGRFNCCRCDRCRRDAAAYALNLLPPKYIVADLASVEKAESAYSHTEILGALVKACLKVRNAPRH